MYKSIVAKKVRAVFAALSAQDDTLLLATLADRFEYRFVGDSPLSGRRTLKAEIEQWWARCIELFPTLEFDVRRVVVQGTPWKTQIATHVALSGNLADGEPYTNEIMQVMEMSWGKATFVTTLEDTHKLHVALARLAHQGNDLATAAPIGAPAGVA
jgi:ketosteroid isomerase-like protein